MKHLLIEISESQVKQLLSELAALSLSVGLSYAVENFFSTEIKVYIEISDDETGIEKIKTIQSKFKARML